MLYMKVIRLCILYLTGGLLLASTPCVADFSHGVTTVIQFRSSLSENRQFKIAGASWDCGGNYCRTSMPVTDILSACKSMATQFGEVALYRANSSIMKGNDLANCNSVVKINQGKLLRKPVIPVTPVTDMSGKNRIRIPEPISSASNPGSDVADGDRTGQVFTLDTESGNIQFGDGRNGDVPDTSRTATARYGAHPENTLSRVRPGVKVIDVIPVTGGTDAESIDESMQRIPENLSHRNSAITGSGGNHKDLVYAEVWTQPVTPLEDGQLREPALDGNGNHGEIPAISPVTDAVDSVKAANISNYTRSASSIKKPTPSAGGTGKQTSIEAGQRHSENLRHRNRAVTQADYSSLVTQSPGISLSRVGVDTVRTGTQCRENQVLNARGKCECPAGTTAYRDGSGTGAIRCVVKQVCAAGQTRDIKGNCQCPAGMTAYRDGSGTGSIRCVAKQACAAGQIRDAKGNCQCPAGTTAYRVGSGTGTQRCVKNQACAPGQIRDAKGYCQCPAGTTAYRDGSGTGAIRCVVKQACTANLSQNTGAGQSAPGNCWESEYQAMPEMDANANSVGIESEKIEIEPFERDPDGDKSDK